MPEFKHFLTWDDFDTFYTEAYRAIDGSEREPHAWQRDLVSRAASGQWCDAVVAPTGAGKSIIATLHVFACAMDPLHHPRMALVSPRRVLVDQTFRDIEDLSGVLTSITADGEAHPVLLAVRERLLARRQPQHDGTYPAKLTPIITHVRRGGLHGARDREWMTDPNACTVLAMTGYAAVSALLFNAIGTRRTAHAMEAGLLGNGTVFVVDEAHLQRQAVATIRSVADLVADNPAGLPTRGLRVIEMTATPTPDIIGDGKSCVTITEADSGDTSTPIGRVLSATKPVRVRDDLSGAGSKVKVAVDELLAMHDAVGIPAGGRTILGVFNVVKDALGTAAALRKKGLRVAVITGRMRPADKERYFSALTRGGDPNIDAVIATQTIEVGVDADFAGMVSVLASGDALAQRIGRVNRRGLSERAPVVLLVPPTDKDGIYSKEDIAAAREWADGLVETGASPLAISQSDVPVRKPTRKVCNRLTRGDAHRLSLTAGDRPFAAESLDFWASDDLVIRPETYVCIRRTVSMSRGGSTRYLDADERAELVEQFPPDSLELWTMHPEAALELVKRLAKSDAAPMVRAITVTTNTGETSEYVKPAESDDNDAAEPDLSWSTVVLWANGPVPMLVSGVPDVDGTEDAEWIDPSELRKDPHNERDGKVAVLLGDEVPSITEKDRSKAAEGAWPDHPLSPRWEAVRRKTGMPQSFVILPKSELAKPRKADEDEAAAESGKDEEQPRKIRKPAWAVALPYAVATESDEDSQTRSTGESHVTLDAHSRDVQQAATTLGALCGLDGEILDALGLAGLEHDAGKVDTDFQRWMLGLTRDADVPVVMAKSAVSTPRNAIPDKRQYGLPSGWRHEQLSAAMAYERHADHAHRDVIVLLAGLSHGRGRSTFPHGMKVLTGGKAVDGTADIFTDGTWEEMLYRATEKFGSWHLAWLEALLRAADHHVSGQGH